MHLQNGILPVLRRTLAVALLGLAAAAPVSAGWSPVGGPAKGSIELKLNPARPELLYARVGDALWRSEDAGATWKSLQSALGRTSKALAIDPRDPEAVWVWTLESELWRSGDAGDTWVRRFVSQADYPPLVLQLLVDPRDSGTIYRVEEDSENFELGSRVAVSHDGGASFQPGGFVPRTFYLDPIAANPRRGELASFNEKGFEVSSDGGRTWQLRGRFHGKGFYGGSLAPSDPKILYGLPVGIPCLARSDDAGAHWRGLTCPRLPPSSLGFHGVAVDPQNPRHVWLTAYVAPPNGYANWLFESKDGGETWAPPYSMPGSGVVPAGGRVVYTGVIVAGLPETGLYVSQDGGRRWKPRDQGIFSGDLRYGLAAQRRPDGSPGRRIFALSSRDDGTAGGLFRSDGGTHWEKLSVSPHSVLGAGGSTVVGANEESLIRSEDGGDTWSAVASSPPEPGGLVADLTQPRYLGVHSFVENDRFGDLFFWTSDDAGATWRLSSDGLPVACTHVASVDYCTGYSGYAVDPFDSNRRWVASQGAFFTISQVFLSTDAGVSWHLVTTDLPGTEIFELAADPAVQGRLLAGTTAGLWISDDGGEHWSRRKTGLPDGAMVHQLARDERTAAWYAATIHHGTYRSLDGGASWTLLEGAPDIAGPTVVVDPRRPTALLAAFPGQGLWIWRD
ncbi:MAG: WD40/YVTN/BNR-like repeat-containing protein [Thermoanaerobaculia bacterium]